MLRYWTAGESHGKALLAMLDGFPAGLNVDTAMIDNELRLRQGGYGRGGRQIGRASWREKVLEISFRPLWLSYP